MLPPASTHVHYRQGTFMCPSYSSMPMTLLSGSTNTLWPVSTSREILSFTHPIALLTIYYYIVHVVKMFLCVHLCMYVCMYVYLFMYVCMFAAVKLVSFCSYCINNLVLYRILTLFQQYVMVCDVFLSTSIEPSCYSSRKPVCRKTLSQSKQLQNLVLDLEF